ncbi:MAG: hypothetical protein ACSLFP_00850 [Acidimicrobiales bacterium]
MKGPGGRGQGDAGQVGGIEALPFGLLIFVVGTLLIANGWAVVDAKFATDAAAREAVRTFVEASDVDDALVLAADAAEGVIAAHGRDPARATVGPIGPARLERCARITIEVTYEVPALSLPLIGGFGTAPFAVRSRRSEVVDPFRSGLDGTAGACL